MQKDAKVDSNLLLWFLQPKRLRNADGFVNVLGVIMTCFLGPWLASSVLVIFSLTTNVPTWSAKPDTNLPN